MCVVTTFAKAESKFFRFATTLHWIALLLSEMSPYVEMAQWLVIDD